MRREVFRFLRVPTLKCPDGMNGRHTCSGTSLIDSTSVYLRTWFTLRMSNPHFGVGSNISHTGNMFAREPQPPSGRLSPQVWIQCSSREKVQKRHLCRTAISAVWSSWNHPTFRDFWASKMCVEREPLS